MSKKEFTYTLRIDAEINDLVAKTAKVRQSMQQVIDSGKAPGAEKIFTSIEHAIDRLRQKASTPITSAAAFSSLQRDTAAVSAQLVKLGGVIENLGDLSEAEKIDLLPADFKQRVKDAQAAVEAFATAYSAATTETKEMAEAQRDLAKAEREQKKAEGKVSEKTALINATKAEITEIEKKKKALEKFLETQSAYEKAGANKSYSGDRTGKQELQGKSLPADRAAAKAVDPSLDLKDTEAVQARIQSLTTEIERAEQAQRRYETSLSEWEKKAQVAGQSVSDLEGRVDALNAEFEQNKAKDTQAAYAKLRTEAGKLGVDLTNIPLDYTEQNLKELTDALIAVKQQGLEQVHQGFNTFQTELNETAVSCDKTKDSIAANKDTFEELDERARNTQAFAQRVKAFVGIQGAANLARRAFQNAFTTVKELDKAMTEMAVVTELEVGDYWKQLPEYTDRANELGVSIKSAYESATLFYQQGLKTNEVVAMSNETLKMARIASLSAEDATNKMTAALRGFNMELNETSAQRVADVYSELAAITASDVNEISSAMTKTASIASNAGMEFETTAAFLSQIIETTRESAETAGTAMKTVIARFQELKKDPSEIGEVDGEVVEANKIETALRSVGVALRDSSGQFRELDDVFLELSSKWDDLDTNTQRYIATIAAGSRQQSRFIAMMSDYGRTQELVSAANTSAGASNKQFQKTMDSLESKLNALSNAWKTFTMSLMNNEFIKKGVDILTALMNTINDIIAFFDQMGLGSVASIGLIVGALYLGDKALTAFRTSIKDGSTMFQALGAAGTGTFKLIKKDIDDTKARFEQFSAKVSLTKSRLANLTTPQQRKAADDYTNALNRQIKAQSELRKLEGQGITNGEEYGKYSEMQVQATLDMGSSLNTLRTAYNLNEQEVQEAIALTKNGIEMDKAAALVKDEKAKAILREKGAFEQLNNEQEKEKLKELTNDLTSGADGVDDFASSLTKIGVAIGSFKLGDWLKNTGKGFVKLGEGIGKAATKVWEFIVANWQLLIVIAVLAIAIIGLVKYLEYLEATSPEGKLKAAEEAAEAAAEAADQAAEAYNELSDSFDNLADKYSTLEDLTAGTREWRDAIREINNEVIDLIDQYPELSNLVTNEDGVLKIDLDSAEAQAVLDRYGDQANKTNSAELAAKMSVLRAQNNVDYNKLSSGAKYGSQEAQDAWLWGSVITGTTAGAAGGAWGGAALGGTVGTVAPGAGNAIGAGAGAIIGGITGGLAGGIGAGIAAHAAVTAIQESEKRSDQEITEALATALANGEITNPNDINQISAYLEEELGILGPVADQMASELSDNTQELIEFGRSLNNAKQQSDMYYDAMAANALSMANTASMSETAQKQIANIASADYMEGFMEKAESEVKEANKENKGWIEEETKKLYGPDITDVKAYNDGSVTFKDKEGNEQRLSYEQFKEQVAAANATEAAAKAMQSVPKAISNATTKLGPEVGKAFKNMFSDKDGKGMTAGDIETMKGQSLDKLWEALGEEGQAAFASKEAFIEQQQAIIKSSETALAQATELSTKAGIDVMSGIGVEAARGYAEKMREVFLASGEETAQQMDAQLHALTDGLNQIDKTKFFSALNALDWTNLDSLESLPETLKELNVNVDPTALNDYIAALGQANGAIRNIDINKLKESAQALTKLSKDIASGEQGRSFSKENYEALVEMNPDLAKDFVLGLDGEYQYIGSAMNELTEAIKDNTSAMMRETMENLDNKIATAEIMDQMKITFAGQELGFSEVAGKEFDNEVVQREILKRLQQNAIKSGVNITGIAGFNESMSVDDLSSEELRKVLDALMTQQSAKGENEKLRQEAAIDTGTMIYQKNTAAQNAYGVWNVAGAGYEKMTQEQKNEFEMRSNALGSQAIVAGVDEKTVSNYTKFLEAYKSGIKTLEDGSDVFAGLKQATADLANATSYKQMREGLQSLFGEISSINEEYSKIAEGEVQGKIALANKALADFGIEVDNAADADMYMELLNQLSQGSETALVTLANAAKGQGEAIDAFFDQMAAAQLGYWKDLGDGTREFVWATVAELKSIANVAGTAVEMWENPYTWLYNQNEQLNRLTREREKYEREYTRALEDESKTAEDLLAISQQQLANLEEQSRVQAIGAARALDDIKAQFDANAEFSEYVRYDATSGTISVDYAGLDAAGIDSDKGSEFEEFLSTIEENRDIILDAEEALRDIEDEVEEVKNKGKEETSDLYNRIKEGLVQSRQNEIDKLSDINESIQDAQASLVDQMQKQIDAARQARDNEKTENEISNKEARLAYLMRDTSGGNATEIASLQKEITEAKEGYADSLIDQSLAELQDANEKAAEQRQHQIDIAQAQLDAYANSSQIWNDVKSILNESLNSGVPFSQTEAGQLASLADGVSEMNPIEKEEWVKDLDGSAKLASIYTGNVLTEDGKTLQSKANEVKNAVVNFQNKIAKQNKEANSITNKGAGNTNIPVTNKQISEKFAGTQGESLVGSGINIDTTAVESGGIDLLERIESGEVTAEIEEVKNGFQKFFTEDIPNWWNTCIAPIFTGEFWQEKWSQIVAWWDKTVAPIFTGEFWSKKFYDMGVALGEFILQIGNFFTELGKEFDKVFTVIGEFFTVTVAQWWNEHIAPIFTAEFWTEKWETIKEGLANAWKTLTAFFTETIPAWWNEHIAPIFTAEFWAEKWESFMIGLKQVWDKISQWWNTNIAPIFTVEYWRSLVDKIGEGLKTGFEAAINAVINGLNYALKGLADIYNNSIGSFISGVASVYGGEDVGKITYTEISPVKFKEGGLADFTGPAWLDGTKSKPEIVLNQRDSANFLVLRDILSDILNGTSSLPKTDKKNGNGDNYYDIEINVESLSDDYDVEQLADKIRSMIYDDATYRNVNTINR